MRSLSRTLRGAITARLQTNPSLTVKELERNNSRLLECAHHFALQASQHLLCDGHDLVASLLQWLSRVSVDDTCPTAVIGLLRHISHDGTLRAIDAPAAQALLEVLGAHAKLLRCCTLSCVEVDGESPWQEPCPDAASEPLTMLARLTDAAWLTLAAAQPCQALSSAMRTNYQPPTLCTSAAQTALFILATACSSQLLQTAFSAQVALSDLVTVVCVLDAATPLHLGQAVQHICIEILSYTALSDTPLVSACPLINQESPSSLASSVRSCNSASICPSLPAVSPTIRKPGCSLLTSTSDTLNNSKPATSLLIPNSSSSLPPCQGTAALAAYSIFQSLLTSPDFFVLLLRTTSKGPTSGEDDEHHSLFLRYTLLPTIRLWAAGMPLDHSWDARLSSLLKARHLVDLVKALHSTGATEPQCCRMATALFSMLQPVLEQQQALQDC